MPDREFAARRAQEQWSREVREWHQLQRVNALLTSILPGNRFYAEKLKEIRLPLTSLADFGRLPLTTRDELSRQQADDDGALRTFGLDHYTRVHRTSGTLGRPYYVYDTAQDWRWWMHTWQFVLDSVEVTRHDRVLMAFSFGPFIGFWSAHDALIERGAMVIATGGMSSLARLECLRDLGATVVFCTPTYAMRLAEAARQMGLSLDTLPVRALVVAGEPGGSVPEVRQRLEACWGARIVDHAGATEAGPWGYADASGRGLHINEAEFIAEFVPHPLVGVDEHASCQELVITPLGRVGCPLIRFQTGDLVRPIQCADSEASPGNQFVLLDGGVLGRADDMITIRGVNIFPSAIEALVRTTHPFSEFRLVRQLRDQMDELSLRVESDETAAEQLAQLITSRLGLRIPVQCVPQDSLERFEAKARRLIDARKGSA